MRILPLLRATAAFALVAGIRADEVRRPDWKALAAVAREHHMPLPGPDARLALVHSESWTSAGNASQPGDPANYEPGWVLEEKPDGKLRVLLGMDEKELEPRKASEPLWRPFSTGKLKPRLGGHVPRFDSPSTFAVAVQCAVRGDLARANALWDAFAAEPFMSAGFGAMRYSQDRKDPHLLFAAMLFDHWELQLTRRGADLKLAELEMAALLKEYPVLSDERRRGLLASVVAANAAKPAVPGSVEALLVEYGNHTPEPYRAKRVGEAEDDPRSRLLRMGFDAIPDLLKLKDDPRATPKRSSGFMRTPSAPLNLGALAREILVLLLPGSSADRPTMFEPSRQGDFSGAWERARKGDEIEYYVSKALGKSGEGKPEEHEGAIAVITAKAPARLEALIERFRKEAGAGEVPWKLTEAVARSGLPVDRKVVLLSGLAGRGGFGTRRMASQVLATVDPAAAKAPAMKLVEELPKDIDGKYWTAEIAAASHVVLEIDDDELWQAFLGKARKAGTGLRMEWMNPFDYAYLGDRQRTRRLAFLAAFLDDRELRDKGRNADRYEGPCAAFTFPTIAVRDFVAMQIASILKIDPLDDPDSSWTPDQWGTLRDKVKARLKEEGIEAMK